MKDWSTQTNAPKTAKSEFQASHIVASHTSDPQDDREPLPEAR
jgi:hypothetical protein